MSCAALRINHGVWFSASRSARLGNGRTNLLTLLDGKRNGHVARVKEESEVFDDLGGFVHALILVEQKTRALGKLSEDPQITLCDVVRGGAKKRVVQLGRKRRQLPPLAQSQ
jgi:hypothetical protein